MIQTAQYSPMDAALLKPRPDFLEDSSGSGAEGRPRKRFQRARSENEDPRLRTGMAPAFGRGNPQSQDQKNSNAKRRSTLRESIKPALLGPRPLESGKRVISDSHFQTSQTSQARAAPSNSSTSSFEHVYNQAMDLDLSGATPTQNSPSRPFKERNVTNGSADFLPSISFDDLHASITGVDADLNSRFPALSSAALNMAPLQPTQNNARQTNGQAAVKAGEPAAKISRSGSLVRRFSTSRRQASQSSVTNDAAQMPPPSGPGNARGRRQSTLPSAVQQTPSASSRLIRKSVGPGFVPPNNTAARSASRDARVPPSQSQPSLIRTGSVSKSNRPGSLLPNPNSNDATSRNSRVKSLQPPPRGQPHLLSQSVSSIGADGSPIVTSPRPRNRAQTPSSGGNNANKRLSTVYVGGLGARTISPTDARRMRRLSSAPKNVPPPPTQPVPSISQPDLIPINRQMSQSPATYVRKTATPSSARNTPDLGKRNGALNHSVSSSSSFSSLRLTNINGPRSSQVVKDSRLPTPKPRNVHSSTGFVEEEVPPVPAIPKAYESPKDQIPEPPFPIPRKSLSNDSDDQSGSRSSLPPSRSAMTRPNPPTVQQSQNFIENQSRGQGNNQRHRRGLTVGAGSDSERPSAQPNLNKKNLQPLRLPPLNLLPLSTPTSARIASLPAPSGEVDARHATPPPKRNITKTPSTPMTASKATFFSRPPASDDEFWAFGNFRSSSSHQPSRPNELDSKNSYLDIGTPIPIPMAGPRNNASPFASNSLPKLSDFGPLSPTPIMTTPTLESLQGSSASFMHPPIEVDLASAPQPSPKAVQQIVQMPNLSTQTSSSDEPSTPASTISLRRKLSLTWKRSSSKASQRAQVAAQQERDEAKAKQNEMPPPKIPASATWSSRTSMDTGSNRPSLDIRPRKPSTTMAQIQADGSASDTAKTESGPPPPYSEHRRPVPRSSSTSLLTPVQRMLGAKGSISTLKNRHLDTNLDKDDLAADKVMEKLASKRKDFEHAAKEVDELRRRAHPKDRVSPSHAIQMVNLNLFERGEIVDFKDVYFCGTRNAKKIVGDPNQTATNFGYDDDRGDYNIVLGDHLAYRYEVIDILGKGSFGQVVRCIDHKTGGLVAVKIIRNKKRFHQQALVEVNILQKLRDWDPENKHSMINFTQSFYFRGHLCISTELLGINLYEFIKAYEFKGFPLVLIRRFTKQILSSLVLLKGKRVIHCDLKPENILLAHPMHSEIKVIDFGSSCFENEKVYTYIQSRFYRSPEVILGMSYGIPIDMWSLGCILAELYTGYPIFPGENEQEQLACIMEIFGPPEKHLIEKSSRKKLFFDSMGKPRVTVSSKGRRRRPSSKTLQSAIKCDDDPFIDFLSQCLRWDPEKRLRPEQAMMHEFITGIKQRPQQPLGPNGRPLPRGAFVSSAAGNPSSASSPAKRYNPNNGNSATMPTPQRGGARDYSGPVRPLPEPPAPGFRSTGNLSGSPAKGAGGGPGRRHSTISGAGPLQGMPPALMPGGGGPPHATAGGGKRVMSSAVGGGPGGPAGPRPQGARVLSGRQPVDLAGQAAAAAAAASATSAAVGVGVGGR